VVSRSLIFIGQRTLDIYLIHYFLLPTSFLIPESMKNNTMWYVQFLVLLLLSLAVTGGCILISNLIRMSPSLATFLLGVKISK
jgi:membrane-bound acyltransferase YfiQ involved in biofilm formation